MYLSEQCGRDNRVEALRDLEGLLKIIWYHEVGLGVLQSMILTKDLFSTGDKSLY